MSAFLMNSKGHIWTNKEDCFHFTVGPWFAKQLALKKDKCDGLFWGVIM